MADDEEAKQKAEAEAEARRKRIIEKGKDRMNKVAGLQAEADDETEETKSSSAARMAAMRRRRFKKGGTKVKAEESEETTADATTDRTDATAGEKAPVTVDSKPAAAEKPVVVEVPKEEPAKAESKQTKKSAPVVEETATTEETTTSDEPKKKYKGVAKMRREKMLQKKKEDAAKAEEDSATISESPGVVLRRKKRVKQPLLPIIMYLVTTMVLFLVGLDVGLQHADPEYILVNREFAPRQFNVQKLIPSWLSSSSSSSGPIKDLDTDGVDYSRDLSEDEFDTMGADEGDDYHVPNIDPIFRVDLDEVTRGPGILMQLGRGAVKIHRMILYLLWELPLSILFLPFQLFSYPPVMCLAALTIRQLLGKLVLGAKLPDAVEEDVRNAKGEMTDVLTMIKNAVMNTVTGTFPNAVGAYEGFKQLKLDMYVMLCGVFVGLLYSTWTTVAEMEAETSYEEPYPVVPDHPPVEQDGIADEL